MMVGIRIPIISEDICPACNGIIENKEESFKIIQDDTCVGHMHVHCANMFEILAERVKEHKDRESESYG